MHLTRTRLLFTGVFAVMVLNACTMQRQPAEFRGFEALHSWPLPKAVAAADLSPAGDFALLSYRGATGDEQLKLHRFQLADGRTRTVTVGRGVDGIMFRATSEAKAIAIAEDGKSFLANWPAYLAWIDSETGAIETVTSLADAGQGMTSFNVLEFSPDYSAAFGLGSDLVRVDLSQGRLSYQRDVPAPGGRSLAVLNAMRAATGSTQSAVIARAGAETSDCSIAGIIAALAGSPSGEHLAGAVYDQANKSTELVVWSAADCSELRRWPVGASSVSDIAWLSDDGLLASAGNDGVLRFWESTTGDLAYSMPVEEAAGFKMHFSEDRTHLLTYTLWGDRTLRAFKRL